MVRILLCCSNGMSTSILVKKMQKAALDKGIEAEIWAAPKLELTAHKDKADVILLGPQIRFALKEIKQEVGEGKPIDVIDVMDYGTMNGSKVLELALSKIK